jgi:hypothetical protein
MTQGQGASPAMLEVAVKSISDPQFREGMINNPEETIKNAGISLSSEELAAVTSSSREEREQMMQQLGERSSQLSFQFFQQFTQFFSFQCFFTQ